MENASEEMAHRVLTVKLPKPSLKDNTGDVERLKNGLSKMVQGESIHMDLSLVKEIPTLLREWDYHVTCVLLKEGARWTIARVADGKVDRPVIGLAVDLGTTRVVVRLIDLRTKEALHESAFDNPQIRIGADILARIHHGSTKAGLDHLNRLIIDGFNGEIKKGCDQCGISPKEIYLMSVAGNTAMTHLFLGIDPRFIIREPYIPAVNRPGVIKARSLGIDIHPNANLFVFPNIGSYFGGDLIAGILYSGIHREEDTAILVDVGTNAEVVLGNNAWLIACAGAAGPALEGGITKMGMMAGPGVIDKVQIDPKTRQFEIHTIEDKPPLGICGSGLIDLVAQLFLAGFVDVRGKFAPDICGEKLIEQNGIKALIIVAESDSGTGKEIVLSQVDLDLFVSSKAAMYTILNTITGSVGAGFHDLKTFFVAGTFGSYIDPVSAITIGMLPDIPLEKYHVLGNSSLGGASLLLTHPELLPEVDQIRNSITYLELNVNQDFMIRFSGAKFFPNTDASLFPSVKVP